MIFAGRVDKALSLYELFVYIVVPKALGKREGVVAVVMAMSMSLCALCTICVCQRARDPGGWAVVMREDCSVRLWRYCVGVGGDSVMG